jgi:hypothetical protein
MTLENIIVILSSQGEHNILSYGESGQRSVFFMISACSMPDDIRQRLLSAKDPMQNMQVTHAPTSSEH